ncbi:MAG: dTDP-4-dehydrorhamnose 3,5-epimerase [Hyphomicrobiales bacterium]|nr:dTDP-4-dehydrorhamnose 3,5-epimerase [Hyphomicrobiales bacterium]
MLEFRPLELAGVYEIKPRQSVDDRGFFSETYSAPAFAKAGVDLVFVQDNHSYSGVTGVLRGLHYQLPPFAQDKLVRVTRGAILDVALDIRASSPTFGRWLSLEISAAKWNQILVPAGFAHGFVTLLPDTEVLYKVSRRYSRAHERSIRFDDPAVGIDWRTPSGGIVLSDKDRAAPLLADAEIFE